MKRIASLVTEVNELHPALRNRAMGTGIEPGKQLPHFEGCQGTRGLVSDLFQERFQGPDDLSSEF